MPIKDVEITYSSPPPKRNLARVIAVVSVVILALCAGSIVGTYGNRKAKGYQPVPLSSLVTLVAPLGIGLWIGGKKEGLPGATSSRSPRRTGWWDRPAGRRRPWMHSPPRQIRNPVAGPGGGGGGEGNCPSHSGAIEPRVWSV